MSPVNDLVKGFKSQLVAQLITAVTGALLTVGLARLLDPSSYGLLLLALAVFSVFGLVAQLGIGRSAGRYVAEYKEARPAQVPHIIRSSVLINLATIGIACLALAVSYRHIADILDEPALGPFLILGVVLVGLGASISFLEKVLQGFEAITFVAVMEVFGGVCRLILALGLVIIGFGAIGALWGFLLSALLTSILGSVYLLRRVRSLRAAESSIEPGLRRRIAEYAVPITATNTAKILDKRVDTLLVGFFLGPIQVSFYVIATQVVSFIETPMSALGFTLSPTFGSQKAAGNIDRISRIYEEALVHSLLLYIPAGMGIALVASPLIELVFGPEYAGAAIVLQVLGIYVILKAVTKITDNGLDYLGRARERAIATAAMAVLNVALNIVLIPRMGVVGAAIATVITYGMYTGANVFIAAQEFTIRVPFLLQSIGIIVVISLAVAAVVFALSGFITGWVTLGLVVAVGVFVWALLSVSTGMLEIRKIVSIMT